MIASPPNVAWKCATCSTERTKPEKRLPKGWKRQEAEVYCAACWQKRYVLRAIAIPVASPIEMEWPAFRAACRTMWHLTTQASNWMVTEFYARDARRTPEVAKIPAMERQYLYPEARKLFPGL